MEYRKDSKIHGISGYTDFMNFLTSIHSYYNMNVL